MKKTILTLLIMLSPVFAFAGDYTNLGSTKSIYSSEKNDADEQVKDDGDHMPAFPGGYDALMAYLANSVRYPADAESKGIEGRVTVDFFVDKDGSITDATVNKPVYPSLDKEALRVINSMPRWIPGKLHGEYVKVHYVVPLTFSLPSRSNRDEHIYDAAEQMPTFPGGNEALESYLSKAIKYPQTAKSKGIQGRAIVTFVVEKDGSITNAAVVKSLDPALDQEALRVIYNMSEWIPGKNDGEYVRVRCNIPVTFRCQ